MTGINRNMSEQTDIKTRSSYHHGDLRGALIAATRTLIEERGVDHFSVSDACRLAGVSTAAPYKHFKNKGEMILAAVLHAMERHRVTLTEDLAAHAPGSVERIVAMGRNYIGFALREPGMFQLRFAQFNRHPLPEIADCGKDIYEMVQNEVRMALGEDSINDLVRERSYMLWSFVHGMSYLTMVPEFAEKMPGVGQDALLLEITERVLRR